MGFFGKIAFVDLNQTAVDIKEMSVEDRRKFLGNRGVNALLTLRYRGKGIGSSGSRNCVMLGAGILSGIGAGFMECGGFSTRFPGTGCHGFAEIPGRFGSKLRWSGFDHVVIAGRAKHPVWIRIENSRFFFEDAGRCKDMGASETLQALRNTVNRGDFSAIIVDSMGKKGSRPGRALTEEGKVFGEAGAGASLAAKNVKAIVCSGTRDIPVKSPKNLLDQLATLMRGEAAFTSGFSDRDIRRDDGMAGTGGTDAKTARPAMDGKEYYRVSGWRLSRKKVHEILAHSLGVQFLPSLRGEGAAVLEAFRNLICFATGLEMSETDLVEAAFRIHALERLMEIRDEKTLLPGKRFTAPSGKSVSPEGWGRRSLLRLKAFRELGIEEFWGQMRPSEDRP